MTDFARFEGCTDDSLMEEFDMLEAIADAARHWGERNIGPEVTDDEIISALLGQVDGYLPDACSIAGCRHAAVATSTVALCEYHNISGRHP